MFTLEDCMKLAHVLAALLCSAALITSVAADPADDARRAKEIEKVREAEKAKRRAEVEAEREKAVRDQAELEPPVMVFNRLLNPVTGKDMGRCEQGSTYLYSTPGSAQNLFWVFDRRDSNIRFLYDTNARKPWEPSGPLFSVNGKILTRTAGADTEPEGDPGPSWTCELPGKGLGELPDWMNAANETLYASYEGGVALINNLTGKILWTSPGPSGSLLLTNEYLFSVGVTDGVVQLVARNSADGSQLWSAELGAGSAQPLVIGDTLAKGENAARQILTARVEGKTPSTRWFSMDGKLVAKIDECADQSFVDASRLLVLTPTRYAALNYDGSTIWELKRSQDNTAGEQWLFASGFAYRLSWDEISDSGVQVEKRAMFEEKPLWAATCKDLGVPHSKYWHRAYGQIRNDKLIVVSQGASGAFVEALKVADGALIHRWSTEEK